MSRPSAWARIRQARLFRVLLVYLAASWLLIQVVGELRDALSLPDWISPVTVILLLIGLVIVLATAWAQAQPGIAARQAVDEVPGSWELDLGDAGRSIARGKLPHLTWARVVLGGVFAFSLLFGLAGLYVVIKDRGRSFAPAEAVAAVAPGIAIVPFSVTGDGLDVWREGMVDLLSTSLDGAGGLRTIEGRTVLARWRERVPKGRVADVTTSLAVAQTAGASYAILGSAVGVGPQVRLAAEIYDVASGRELGGAQVEGVPDSVLVLVDRLAVEVLRAILGSEASQAAPVHLLASITTASLPALRAYLEGEALFRRGDFVGAIAEYERAVAADSTFALAYYRLANSYGWAESIRSPSIAEPLSRAIRHIDRVPQRDAELIRADQALNEGRLDGLEPLRRAVRQHPDDAEAWYLLGDTYYHLGEQALVERAEMGRAFSRAIEIDPEFSPYYIHLIEQVLHDGDSTRAASVVTTPCRSAPSSRFCKAGRLGVDLLFGTAAAKEQALAALDTLDRQTLTDLYLNLNSPAGFRYGQAAIHAARALPDADPATAYYAALVLIARGRLHEAADRLDDPLLNEGARVHLSLLLYAYGFRRDGDLERVLEVREPGPQVPAPIPVPSGAHAADQARWSDHARAMALLRERAAALLRQGDTLGARRWTGAARALDGYARWKRGELEGALSLLETAQQEVVGLTGFQVQNRFIRRWIAEVYAQLGRPQDAVRYYRSLADALLPEPLAYLRLGELYAQLGETENARRAFTDFLTAWEDADADSPLPARAREAMVALPASP